MSLLHIALSIWLISIGLLFWRSTLVGVARPLHAVLALPVLALFVTLNVIVVNALVPGAYSALRWFKESDYFSSLEPYAAFVIYGSVPALLFWLWLSFLRKLSNSASPSDL
ncbi:hypothetical protein [Pseudomarimonas arenosa]|uniref:Transmembrane protein n=1 Tax=Pseudomarimonas arenosa TaxID=2774145 RepID=A0AAW3ZSK3_9GAMM|nr:hypothetical protein [Pseudomarimonas arenosa]MBD8528017.1 hypothetical protein [Pseudomarimonas arenosa]